MGLPPRNWHKPSTQSVPSRNLPGRWCTSRGWSGMDSWSVPGQAVCGRMECRTTGRRRPTRRGSGCLTETPGPPIVYTTDRTTVFTRYRQEPQQMDGVVTAVARSATHTMTKPNEGRIRLLEGLGVE